MDRTTVGFAALANIATNTMTITGLLPLTNYDYYFTAVDVFGQEVAVVDAPAGTVQTQAASIDVTITDGIVEYPDSSFELTNPPALNPASRPMRKTAIRVTLYLVAAGSQPDSVRLIVAGTNEPIPPGAPDPDLMIARPAINPALVLGTDYFLYPCSKTGPNTWTGYIPESNPFIASGNSVRFLIESILGGVSSFNDSNSEAPGPVNDVEWTFATSTSTKFKPWPTRILNNVITSKNPVAYPAYYLSEDAFVTITVYDIKGRPLVSLLDNAFRLGGQNIKEGGWRGINRSNRKLGVGLYYVNITAKSASSGKVILNSFQKVVIAR